MSGHSASVFQVYTGSALAEEVELLFNLTSKKIVITNDDPSDSLFFKFRASGKYAELKPGNPGESLSILFRTTGLWVKGNQTLYRIFVFG